MEPPDFRGELFLLKATACVQPQPCYNPARLENGRTRTVKDKKTRGPSDRKFLSRTGLHLLWMNTSMPEPYLKIGDVARKVGVSPSVIRSWESLGLTRPRRTESKYRLYTAGDVKLLKRARFLRKVRGLNAAAIVQMLKREEKCARRRMAGAGAIGVTPAAVAVEAPAFPGAGGDGGGNLGGISERAGTLADERLGWNAAQAGALLQNQYPRFFRCRRSQQPMGASRNERC
jgi:DNA-binding transcriptional MerR regulator